MPVLKSDSSRWIVDGLSLTQELSRLQSLSSWSEWGVVDRILKLKITLHRTRKPYTTGHHQRSRHRIHLSVGTGPWYEASKTLLHEMVHEAHSDRFPESPPHDVNFHRMMARAACEAYTVDPEELQRAYETQGGASRGYSMDVALLYLLRERFGGPNTPLEARLPGPPAERFISYEDQGLEVRLPGLCLSLIQFPIWQGENRWEQMPDIEFRRFGSGRQAILKGSPDQVRRVRDWLAKADPLGSAEKQALVTALDRINTALKEA